MSIEEKKQVVARPGRHSDCWPFCFLSPIRGNDFRTYLPKKWLPPYWDLILI